jgi:hypothetical protein
MHMRTEDGRTVSETPEQNITTAVEYITNTYGDDMTYWERTNEHPGALPVPEREAWHREAWDREQDALTETIKQTRRQTERDVFRASMQG